MPLLTSVLHFRVELGLFNGYLPSERVQLSMTVKYRAMTVCFFGTLQVLIHNGAELTAII